MPVPSECSSSGIGHAQIAAVLVWLSQAPQWQELLAPWLDKHAPTLPPQAPPAPLDLLWWLAGLAGFPDCLTQDLRHWSKGTTDNSLALQQTLTKALQREREPLMEWVWRALRHLPVWLAGKPLPYPAYYSLRRLHFVTQGASSHCIAWLHQNLTPSELPAPESPLLSFTAEQKQAMIYALNQRGFVCLPQRLPAALISDIQQFARQTPCRPSLPDISRTHPQQSRRAQLPRLIFDPPSAETTNCLAHRYDFDFEELWECQAIQTLAAEPLWFWLAEHYLRSQAHLLAVWLWWSAPCNKPQSNYTGQVFHVDLDRFHFVNLFFYLSDVGPRNGPQVYLRGSHQRLPLPLSEDRRWSDTDVLSHSPPEQLSEVCGPAGTIILANTLALHKGTPVQQGARLTLQLEFASSTLGEALPQVPRPEKVHSQLARRLQAYPKAYPQLQSW